MSNAQYGMPTQDGLTPRPTVVTDVVLACHDCDLVRSYHRVSVGTRAARRHIVRTGGHDAGVAVTRLFRFQPNPHGRQETR